MGLAHRQVDGDMNITGHRRTFKKNMDLYIRTWWPCRGALISMERMW